MKRVKNLVDNRADEALERLLDHHVDTLPDTKVLLRPVRTYERTYSNVY